MIEPKTSMAEFFRDMVLEAIEDQNVEATELTEGYLVALLAEMATPGRHEAPDPLSETIVELMQQAFESSGSQRAKRWRHIGDTALVATGLYRGMLLKRGMDLNYYFLMGASAYRQAATLHHFLGAQPLDELCDELGAKMVPLSDVLDQVMAMTYLHGDQGLIRLLARWKQQETSWVGRRLIKEGLWKQS